MSFSTFGTFGTSEVISYAVGVGIGVGGIAGQGVAAGIVSGLLALSAFLGLQLLEWLLLRAWRAGQQRRSKPNYLELQGKKPWSWVNWSPIHGQQKATSQPPSGSWPPTYGQATQKKMAERVGITPEAVLKEYARLGFLDPRKFFRSDGSPQDITPEPEDEEEPTYGQPHAAHPRASPLAHVTEDTPEPEDEEERDQSRREKRTFWS